MKKQKGVGMHSDLMINAVARSFWRRIEPFKNKYGKELPEPLPAEFEAHMGTALTWVKYKPLNTLLFECLETGDDLGMCSLPTDNEDGSYSFFVENCMGTKRYKHTIKTEEA